MQFDGIKPGGITLSDGNTYRKTSHRPLAVLLALGAVLFAGVGAALAQSVTPEDMFERLFTSDSAAAEWFTEEFVAQLPPAAVDAIIGQYRAVLGAYTGAQGVAPNFRLSFEHGFVNAQLVLTAAGQIAGIWFGPPELKVSGLDEALAGFYELPGSVSLIVVSDTGVLAAIDPDTPLAVGSAFKLAIAAALKDEVAAGARSWDDVVVLEAGDVSLPTGILQEWPVGTPMTIQSLATLMISISDNTATDVLLRVVGRDTVERYAPRNAPFLSTREAFLLKAAGNEDALEAWRARDEAGRRALLDELARRPLPGFEAFGSEPTALDVEWYFTVGELVNLMAYVHELPFMSINPGVANPSQWRHVAYKGGSEPGVLNYTTMVVSESGTPYFLSATWNNPEQALDEALFYTLYSGLLSALAQMEIGNN